MPLEVIRSNEPAFITAPLLTGCNVIALRASVLRYLRRFLVSTFCPLRMMAEDLPSSALFWMTWYKAAFFAVEVIFFKFHFLI